MPRAPIPSSRRRSGDGTAEPGELNLELPGIPHADIPQADTIRKPQHKDENGELKRYDRELAILLSARTIFWTKTKKDRVRGELMPTKMAAAPPAE